MRNLSEFFSHALLPLHFASAAAGVPNTMLMSDDMEVQRRRKSDGPDGRAEAPVRRDQGGGNRSSGGGSGSGGMKLPPWLTIVIVIIILVCGGGKTVFDSLFGGEDGSTPTEESAPAEVPVVDAPTAIPSNFTPQAVAQDCQTWTVMIYQDADDQILEKDIFTDFNEAERIGSTDHVQIVAQLDRFKGAFRGDGNWSGARRYYITQDDDLSKINSKVMDDLGEVNMADPATLVDFATWAIKTFPADHYVLILSDHGMGWPGGWTDGDMEDSVVASERIPLVKVLGNALYLNQLDEALGQIRKQSGIEKFDVIGMDACLMGQLEVFSMLEAHSRYAVTSEETEPALGWAYTAFLQTVAETPGISAADLSKSVVKTYIDGDQRIVDDDARADFVRELGGSRASAAQMAKEMSQDVTLAAVDLSKIPALMGSVDDLAYALQSDDQSTIAGARSHALAFTNVFTEKGFSGYIDLGSFVQLLQSESIDENVQKLSGDVLAGIKQAVIAEKHGSSKKGATGVAIYFPNSSLYKSPYSGPQSYTAVAGRFAKNSLWDDFLAFHYNDRSFEPSTREVVVPSNGPTRAPGAGQIKISSLKASSKEAAPGDPVTLSAKITGKNIGYAYLFIGYYDPASNSIFVADTDYLESPDTREVDGVFYPKWSDKGSFNMKFNWDPTVFSITDGQKTVMALFAPQQYGASADDASYAVDGIYTFTENGSQLNARLYFRNGKLVSVFGVTGQGETGAPRQITPQPGDTFTLLNTWLDLNSDGSVKESTTQQGETLTFSDQPFEWKEQYAAAGDYIVGFSIADMDGNTTEAYTQVTVK
jgi:clostripain